MNILLSVGDNFKYNPIEEENMKLASWNVNGLRACLGKGFEDYLADESPDFLCLQEIKLSEGQMDRSFPGYEAYYNYAARKGYSGTAVLTRHKPLSVAFGSDDEGRVIEMEYPDFYLVNVYTPNSQEQLARLEYRLYWDSEFRTRMFELDKNKPVLICGDMNVARGPDELKNPKSNERNAGYTIEERQSFELLLKGGFTDSFRHFYPDLKEAYSWWSYRFHARENNAGWRIDYWLASDRIVPLLRDSIIRSDVMGSDHCPVVLTADLRT